MTDRLAPTVVGGLRVWVSPSLAGAGISHAFTTRHGGLSEGPFYSLNLGYSTGDLPDRVGANRRRLCAAFDVAPEALRFVRQVHGVELVDAATARPPEGDGGELVEADGLIATVPGLLLGVQIADCLPVLLASPDGRAVAAVHAGWRGLAQGILSAAVDALATRAAVSPRSLIAAIGPGISAASYEVGPEVAARFPAEHVDRSTAGRPHVDLPGVAAAQLAEAGVAIIDAGGPCTVARPEEFFSHRRDGGRTGRQAGVIMASR